MVLWLIQLRVWGACCIRLHLFTSFRPERCSFHAHSRLCFGLSGMSIKLYCLSQSQIKRWQATTILYTGVQHFHLTQPHESESAYRFNRQKQRGKSPARDYDDSLIICLRMLISNIFRYWISWIFNLQLSSAWITLFIQVNLQHFNSTFYFSILIIYSQT